MIDQSTVSAGTIKGRSGMHASPFFVIAVWVAAAVILIAAAGLVARSSAEFGHDVELLDMPILEFGLAYVGLSLAFVFVIPVLVRMTGTGMTMRVFWLVVASGLAMRMIAFGSTTVLEDDYHRYLWDGAVVAVGENPYRFSPDEIEDAVAGTETLQPLVEASGDTFWRINYPEFSTVYPPVAQSFFVLANAIKPFSLDAWRLVLLGVETGCLVLIVMILQALGRSPLWAAIYWWNPLALKEISNSAHMEPVLMLAVLWAAWLALRQREVLSSAFLALAAGVKIWPVLLGAVLLRKLFSTPGRLVLAGGLVGLVLALMALPILSVGIAENSGFRAFATQWRASSAAYLVAEWISVQVAVFSGIPVDPGFAARMLLAATLVAAIAVITLRPLQPANASEGREMLWRMFVVVAALYLLSASHTPWYFLWVLPFLCFFPVRGLLLAGGLIPLHYVFFYFHARDLDDVYHHGVVWLIWLPVWALLVHDFWQARALSGVKREAIHAAG